MKIFVTGGAGFIGSHVVDKYVGLGHEVVVIDDLSTGKKEFVNSQAKFYQVDIRNYRQIEEVFKKEKPQVLNHHAAQIEVRRSVADPIFDAQTNIIGLLNLLEAGRKNGLTKVIFASSGGAVYGEAEVLPTPENYPPQPASPYGISKLTSEYYLHFYLQTYQIKYLALRYANVYGPRQNPYGEAGVVAIFTQKLLNNEQPIINGDGKQTRDFVYVSDIVKANQKALDCDNNLIVNIGTGKETSINEIFSQLETMIKSSLSPKYGAEKKGEQRRSVLEVTLARTKLAWNAEFSLHQGLADTIYYFRNEKAKAE